MTTNERKLVERYEMEHFEVEGNTVDRTWDIYEKRKKVVVKYTATNINCNFYAVQFKIENYDWKKKRVPLFVVYRENNFGWYSVEVNRVYVTTGAIHYLTLTEPGPLRIGRDTQEQWSTPVIFNREQHNKLPDLVKYLEDKLNASHEEA